MSHMVSDVYKRQEYIVDESLPEGTVTWWTDACYGYTAEGEKVFYKNGQEVKREPIDSSYYMEGAAVYKIGPNTDPNAPSQNGGGDKPANSTSSSAGNSSSNTCLLYTSLESSNP